MCANWLESNRRNSNGNRTRKIPQGSNGGRNNIAHPWFRQPNLVEDHQIQIGRRYLMQFSTSPQRLCMAAVASWFPGLANSLWVFFSSWSEASLWQAMNETLWNAVRTQEEWLDNGQSICHTLSLSYKYPILRIVLSCLVKDGCFRDYMGIDPHCEG